MSLTYYNITYYFDTYNLTYYFDTYNLTYYFDLDRHEAKHSDNTYTSAREHTPAPSSSLPPTVIAISGISISDEDSVIFITDCNQWDCNQ